LRAFLKAMTDVDDRMLIGKLFQDLTAVTEMLVDQTVFVAGTIKFPAVDERRRRRASTEPTGRHISAM